MKKYLLAGLSAATLLAAPAASAGVLTLDFGESSLSSNETSTGASADVTLAFDDEGDGVRLTVTVDNTTDETDFGLGAMEGQLTGFAFDLPGGASYVKGSFTTTGYLDTLIADASLPPFGTFDLAFADNKNFVGGNAKGALPEGQSATMSVLLATTADADMLMEAFSTALFSGELHAALRFQSVGPDGELSDKLLFNDLNPVPVPGAAALMLTGLIGGAGARRLRRR